MARVLIAGDVHGEPNIQRAERIAIENNCDHMILCGDVWSLTMPREIPTHMISGNHENFLLWDTLVNNPDMRAENVIIHDYWDTFEIDGVKFGSVGKIDKESHAHLAHEIRWLWDALGPKPDIWMEKKPENEVRELFTGIDVLITHDAPYPMELRRWDEWTEVQTVEVVGSKYLADIIGWIKPQICFGGHMHEWFKRPVHGVPTYALNQVSKNTVNSYAILDGVQLKRTF